MEASDRLKEEGYHHNLVILSGKPHNEVLGAIARADVVIDQLLIGWYGLVAVEAWAYRKPVICYIRPDLYAKYDLPACWADPATIADAMREMMKYPDTRVMWSACGREYVERVHDIRNFNL